MGKPAGQDRKRILADPVSAGREHGLQAGDTRLEELKVLHESYSTLQQQCREVRARTQSLSRRIGSSKRDGEVDDELIAAMQEQSRELKSLSSRQKETESAILDFFSATAEPEQDPPPETAPVRYPASTEPAVEITQLGKQTGEWNEYAAGNPAATIYHRAEWRELIRQTFGHECLYLQAKDSDRRVIGILPLVHLESRLFGNFMVSMPFFNYGGALADHPGVEAKLMTAANEYAGEKGIQHIEYRDTLLREGLPVSSRKVCMLLKLPATHDELWDSFPSKLRSQIRRPARENPEVLVGGSEYLDDYYSVFSRNMRDLGTPVYARDFFANILETFSKESKLVSLRIEGKPVAAAFLLGHGDRLEIPWASTVRDVNHLSMNMLLYWEVLKFAIERQYRVFDFGRSSPDSGTFHFKQQWGAQPVPLYWHYWLRAGGQPPAINPDNPKYAMAINVWKKIPLFAANLIGPMVVKYLP
jgi:FemAB-related protein (PEP-CTERM system-associated)